jgi:hypothetical protein
MKARILVPAIYLAAVFACMLLAFNYEGSVDTVWTLALIALTLPWSLVSVLFAWSLIHGAGLEFFSFIYLAFAGLNAYLLYRLCLFLERKQGGNRS